jgi:hypothetical protein
MKVKILLPESDAPAPLFAVGRKGMRPAYLELNIRTAEARYGVCPDDQIPDGEPEHVVRWTVAPNTRTTHVATMADELLPILQRVQDGWIGAINRAASEIASGQPLNQDAEKAIQQIQSKFPRPDDVRTGDAFHFFVWSAPQLAMYLMNELSVFWSEMSHNEIYHLASEWTEKIAEDGELIEGCLENAMLAQRNMMQT